MSLPTRRRLLLRPRREDSDARRRDVQDVQPLLELRLFCGGLVVEDRLEVDTQLRRIAGQVQAVPE